MPPFLRDIPTRSNYLELEGVENLARNAAQPAAKARTLGKLGDVYRAMRRPDAVETLQEAVRASQKAESPALLRANRLRLATALFYTGEHATAESMLQELREETEGGGAPALEDYVLQHLAKCIAEQGRYKEAADLFEGALALRTELSRRPSLIESSQIALAEARRRALGPAATRPPRGAEPAGHINSEWLQRWHDQNPGATREAFASGADQDGHSSYQRLAAMVSEQDAVLDLACGDGTLLALIGDQRDHVALAGIDISERELALAEGRMQGRNVSLFDGRAHELPFAENSFDVVLCHMALMLFDQLEGVLSEVARVCKPNGTFGAVVGGGGTEGSDDAWALLMEHLQKLEFAETVQLIDGRAMDPEAVTELLQDASFQDCVVEPFVLTFDATPADVWACFATSYDPVRLAPADLDALRERFFVEVQGLVKADGRVPFQFGMQQITAIAPPGESESG